MDIVEFVKKNQDVFSVSGLERRANIPASMLAKAIKDKQALPDKYREPLRNEIRKLLLPVLNDI